MPAGSLSAAYTHDGRITVETAWVYLRPTVFSVIGGVLVPDTFNPDDLLTENIAFGPAMRIRIQDPTAYVTQTAGSDRGDHNVPTRKGTWTVGIEAMCDIVARAQTEGDNLPYGDARFGELIGSVVDFAIWATVLEPLVYGAGIFSGDISLNPQEGDPIIRDVKIVRHHGTTRGNLKWADLEAGTWPSV